MIDPFELQDTEIDGIKLSVPKIVINLFDFINDNIIEGIFRINGSLKKINYYYSNLPKYHKWIESANIYDICSLLKKILNVNYEFFHSKDFTFQFLQNFSWDKFNEKVLKLSFKPFNLFIYVIKRLNNLLTRNEDTKMSMLNYAIIFQPILFNCDNLVILPNFINLLNNILKDNDKLITEYPKDRSSFIDKDDINTAGDKSNSKTSSKSMSSSKNNSTTSNTGLFPSFYKFKNFKNKSFDSINESLKLRISARSDANHNGSSIFKQKYNMSSSNVSKPVEEEVSPLDNYEKFDKSLELLNSSLKSPISSKDSNSGLLANNDNISTSTSVKLDHDINDNENDDKSTNDSHNDLINDNHTSHSHSPSKNNRISVLTSDKSYQSLDPIDKFQDCYNETYESLDPIDESPQSKISELVNSIDSVYADPRSIAPSFDIDDANSILTTDSYKSINEPKTVDNSFNNDNELPEPDLLPQTSRPEQLNPSDEVSQKKSTPNKKPIKGFKPPQNPPLSKRKSLIDIFKSDNSFVKRNFSVKLKSRNVL